MYSSWDTKSDIYNKLLKWKLLAQIISSDLDFLILIEQIWEHKNAFSSEHNKMLNEIDDVLSKRCPKILFNLKRLIMADKIEFDKLVTILKVTKNKELKRYIESLISNVFYTNKIDCSLLLNKYKYLLFRLRHGQIEHCLVQYINTINMEQIIKLFKSLYKKHLKGHFGYGTIEDFLSTLDKTNKPFIQFINIKSLTNKEKVFAFTVYNMNNRIKDKYFYLKFILENIDVMDYHIFTYDSFENYIKPELDFNKELEKELSKKCQELLTKNPFNRWLNIFIKK